MGEHVFRPRIVGDVTADGRLQTDTFSSERSFAPRVVVFVEVALVAACTLRAGNPVFERIRRRLIRALIPA